MNATLLRLLICASLSALILAGCAATQVTSDWKDPSFQTQPRKVLVVAITKKAANRRILEDEFVKRIKELGVDAIPGYTVIPDQNQGKGEVVAASMKQQGADSVLITRLLNRKTVKTYVPGDFAPVGPYNAWYDRYPAYYGTWPDYYGYGFQSMYTPGYMAEDEYAIMETNLYNGSNEKLVWSASSETEIRGSDPKFIRSYVDTMIKEMIKHGLLPKGGTSG